MKALAQQIWNEPAVAIGLLTSAAMLVIQLAAGDTTTTDIITIAAPFLSALGIRPLVTPTNKQASNIVIDKPVVPYDDANNK